MIHETNALRKRRKKSRKKKRKKHNSSSAHPDEPVPALPNNTQLDEISLLDLNDSAANHHASTSPMTTISINEQDEIGHSATVIHQRRNCFIRFYYSIISPIFSFLFRQIRSFLIRYHCLKKTASDNDSNDSTDQIPLTEKVYEFYNAPVTKFFQDLIFFILFLAIFTYVVLIRTPPKPSICEWILMVYLTTMAMDLVRELLMMSETRWKTWISVYFHDVLHLYDTFCCLMFALAFGLRLTNDFRIVGRLLLCINLSLWYLRMFHFLVVSKEVGPYIHIAARNVRMSIFQKNLFEKKILLDYRFISYDCNCFNCFNQFWCITTSN